MLKLTDTNTEPEPLTESVFYIFVNQTIYMDDIKYT